MKQKSFYHNISTNYFTKQDQTYECKECHTKISLKNSTMTNLGQHLSRKHPDLWKKIAIGKKSTTKSSIDSLIDNKDNITYQFVKFISESKYPLNIVKDLAFNNLIYSIRPDIAIPSPYDIEKGLKLNVMNMKDRLFELIKKSAGVSLFSDIWTYFNKIVICTFIRINTYENSYNSTILDLSELTSQKASNIKEYFLNLTKLFKIPTSHLISITTDNCVTMTKAVKDYIENSPETFNTEIETKLDIDNKLDFLPNEGGLKLTFSTEIKSEVSDFYLLQTIKEILFEGKKFIHLGCSIHKIQLCLKNSFDKNNDFINLVNKLEKITKNTRKTSFMSFGKRLPKIAPTRWNSRHMLIKEYLSIHEEYMNFLQNINSKDLNLEVISNEDISFLKASEKVLNKTTIITQVLESEKGDLSVVKNIIDKLVQKLETNKNHAKLPKSLTTIIEILLEKIKFYFEPTFIECEKIITVLSYLRPSLYVELSKIEKKKARALLKKLFVNEPIELNMQCPIETPITELNGFLDSESDSRVTDAKDNIQNEISNHDYKISRTLYKDIQYWDFYKGEFPRLNKVFRILSVMGSSNGDVERSFSTCKHFSYWKKNRISVAMIELRLISNLGKLEKINS